MAATGENRCHDQCTLLDRRLEAKTGLCAPTIRGVGEDSLKSLGTLKVSRLRSRALATLVAVCSLLGHWADESSLRTNASCQPMHVGMPLVPVRIRTLCCIAWIHGVAARRWYPCAVNMPGIADEKLTSRKENAPPSQGRLHSGGAVPDCMEVDCVAYMKARRQRVEQVEAVLGQLVSSCLPAGPET